ncbi:DUF2264 domain-containing protein [Tessaracoccus terricola]
MTSRSTSWDRARLATFADQLLLAVRPHASSGKARFDLPGQRSGLGPDVDALEAYARTFLLAGFRLAGESGADPLGLADWYAEGLASGTDPNSPERWLRLEEHPQAKVEAASIALVLDLTREWIWDRLDTSVQRNVIGYLAAAVGDDTYPQINWVWFRLVVQTFLRSVDGPHELAEMRADLATHDTFVRADGWMADGPERAFDHYNGWALHLYPTLWARMRGAEGLAESRAQQDRAALERFLTDAVRLVGADGSPLLQGRSLAYRFAAAAPFWVGAMAEVPSLPPGQLRRAASRIVEHFATGGVPNSDGLLDIGWFGEWPDLAQAYSGPGSPYWASKGLLGLALPAGHPVWTSPEVPLPAETDDAVTAISAPGWLVSSTVADGVVRVINHGTDHAVAGAQVADSPLYARLGYSTATAPLLDESSWLDPLDNSVVVLDADGNASHRAGMELLDVRVDQTDAGPVGVAASVADAHWVAADEVQFHHGSGYTGTPAAAGRVTVVSLVRGAQEIRLVHLADAPERARQLRIGGWPLAGAAADRLRSVVLAPDTPAGAHTHTRADASPLGAEATTPSVVLDLPLQGWAWALVELSADPAGTAPRVDVAETATGIEATVTWPDGQRTTTRLTTDQSRAHRAGAGNQPDPEPGLQLHEGV